MIKKIFFHGTAKKFKNFDVEYLGQSTSSICGGSGNKLGFYFTDDAEIAKKYSREAGANDGQEIVLVCEFECEYKFIDDGWHSSDIENMSDDDISLLADDIFEMYIMKNPYYTEYCIPAKHAEKIKILGILN